MDKNYTVVETSKIAAVRAGHLYSLITGTLVMLAIWPLMLRVWKLTSFWLPLLI